MSLKRKMLGKKQRVAFLEFTKMSHLKSWTYSFAWTAQPSVATVWGTGKACWCLRGGTGGLLKCLQARLRVCDYTAWKMHIRSPWSCTRDYGSVQMCELEMGVLCFVEITAWQVFASPIAPPTAALLNSLHNQGPSSGVAHQSLLQSSRLFPTSSVSNWSSKETGGTASLHSWWMVSCLRRCGRVSWAAVWIGVPLPKKDPRGTRSPVSGSGGWGEWTWKQLSGGTSCFIWSTKCPSGNLNQTACSSS